MASCTIDGLAESLTGQNIFSSKKSAGPQKTSFTLGEEAGWMAAVTEFELWSFSGVRDTDAQLPVVHDGAVCYKLTELNFIFQFTTEIHQPLDKPDSSVPCGQKSEGKNFISLKIRAYPLHHYKIITRLIGKFVIDYAHYISLWRNWL